MDRELELVDYLRDMWHRKWIIVGCIALAIAAAAGAATLCPVKYSGTAAYEVRESVTSLVRDCAPALAAGGALFPTLLAVANDAHAAVPESELVVTALGGDSRVYVAIGGASTRSSLPEAFDRLAVAIKERYATLASGIVARAVEAQKLRVAQIAAARDLLTDRIESPDVLAAPSLASALVERVSELELEQARDGGRLEVLRQVNPALLFSLDVAVPLSISEQKPSLRLLLPIGAVVGLFAGVLAALFVDYFATARRRAEDRPQASAPKAH